MKIVINYLIKMPIYRQIANQIKTLVIQGNLKPGEAIPSIRSLAKSLKISVITVRNAYELLKNMGFIESLPGKGYFVSSQNHNFYIEEQQKIIKEIFLKAIEIAITNDIKLDKLLELLTFLYLND